MFGHLSIFFIELYKALCKLASMIKVKKISNLYDIANGDLSNTIWSHLEMPTDSEINTLCNKLDIPEDFLRDPLDRDERSRAETEDNANFMIIRAPVKIVDGDIPFMTVPLGIIISKKDEVVTVTSESTLLNSITNMKQRNCINNSKMHFVFNLLYKIAILYLNDLKVINAIIEEYEEHLRRSMRNQELTMLLNLEKSLIYFTTSLKSNELTLEKIRAMRQDRSMLNDDDIEILDDIIIEYKQALEMTTIYSNILSGMMDAFASIISNNMNSVMKFLTSFAIVLTIPVALSGIYGMNVALPFQHNPHAFLILIFISLVLSTLTSLVFFWKKWF